MPGEGRTFRRNTVEFWEIWPMPPKIDIPSDVVYVDGIYLSRKVCILICCDAEHILGWYICRSENSRAWIALLSRIATPKVVVSDGGTGFRKALKKLGQKPSYNAVPLKAVCWWCYMHLPRPLSYTEILKTMPTEKSISKIYNTMNTRSRLETIIPTWGDAIVWSDLHKSDSYPNFEWD